VAWLQRPCVREAGVSIAGKAAIAAAGALVGLAISLATWTFIDTASPPSTNVVRRVPISNDSPRLLYVGVEDTKKIAILRVTILTLDRKNQRLRVRLEPRLNASLLQHIVRFGPTYKATPAVKIWQSKQLPRGFLSTEVAPWTARRGSTILLDLENWLLTAPSTRLALPLSPLIEDALAHDDLSFPLYSTAPFLGAGFMPRPKSSGLARTLWLPLQAQPQAFPSDWYQYTASPTLWLPPDVRYVTHGRWWNGKPSKIYEEDVPVGVELAVGSSMQGTLVRADPTLSPRNTPIIPSAALAVRIETSRLIKLYTYAIASIPLFLVLIAGVFLFRGGLRRGMPMQFSGTAITLVVGLLAVLPVRAVTVPPDEPSLTRVDILLGCSVILSLAVLVAGAGLAILSRTNSDVRQKIWLPPTVR
jgi:hypothetical protein